MDGSLLRDEIIIQTYTESRDLIGGVTETWSTFAIVYAYARSVRSTDRYLSARIIPIEAYDFVIRWLNDITPKMRISWKNKIYRITGIEPYDDRAWIKLSAEAVDQGGVGNS